MKVEENIFFRKPLAELAPIAFPRPRFYKPWPEENFRSSSRKEPAAVVILATVPILIGSEM